MDKKNRLTITLSIIALVMVALLASFSRTVFLHSIPSVSLADPDDAQQGESAFGHYWLVAATPETVQAIVETIARPDSYYRELTVEYLWSGGGSATSVQVWHHQGYTYARLDDQSGAVENRLSDGQALYSWYEGSSQLLQAPVDAAGDDLAQIIPTYESLLDAHPSDILEAGYEMKDGTACVYAAVQRGANSVERFWISVGQGLLMAAQREQGGQVVYRLSSVGGITVPCPSDTSFDLPDGSTLFST